MGVRRAKTSKKGNRKTTRCAVIGPHSALFGDSVCLFFGFCLWGDKFIALAVDVDDFNRRVVFEMFA